MDTTQPIQFRVKGIITELTAPDDEGVGFTLTGFGVAEGSLSSSTYVVTPVVSSKLLSSSYIQNTYFLTEWSDNLSISNLSIDSLNQFRFQRTSMHPISDFIQMIGVVEIQMRYKQKIKY
jgi:hypothetical protein